MKISRRLIFLTMIVIFIHCNIKMQTEVATIVKQKTRDLSPDIIDKFDLAWSPDGSSIACSYNYGAAELELYSTTGENSGSLGQIIDDITMFLLFNDAFIAISPDGAQIVYSSYHKRHLWIHLLGTGAETLLSPDHKYVFEPCWSPTGEYIAYVYNFYNIWIIPATGGNATQLTTGFGVEYHNPSFSPDGTKIVASISGSHKNIGIIPVAGGPFQQITADSTNDYFPVWSPDGSQIAFLSNRNDTTAIWLISPDGGKEIKLTKSFHYVSYPAWSPDGTKIAFRTTYNRICIVSVPDGNIVHVFKNKKGYPLWLPDGNTLLIPRPVDFKIINTTSVLNRQVTNVTTGSGNDISPTWTPDNQSLVFIRDNNIWMISAAGGDEISITDDSTKVKYNPEVSPDGLYIAFDNGYDIYIMPFNGTNAINITKQINETLSHPTWSPDGTRIACCVPYGLKIFSLRNMNNLIEDAFIPGNLVNPDWSVEHPELGSHIAVEQVIDEFFSNIYVISLNDLKPEQVIKNGKFPSWSPDGTELAYLYRDHIYTSQIFQQLD